MKNINWSIIIKVFIAMLTALVGAIGIAACTR